jgi:hypothetical protein
MEVDDPRIRLRLTTDSSGSVHASGRSTFVVFSGQTLEQVANGYRSAFDKVFSVLIERWNSIQETNIPFDDLADLAQRITLHELRFQDSNYHRLELRVGGRRHNALHPGAAYDDVQWVISRTIPRGRDGHDELGAALLGIAVDKYRSIAASQDRHANR